jgi:uncharacterized protein
MRIARAWFATLLFLLVSLFAGALFAATGDFADIPQLKARVTDTTGTLSPGDIASIEAQLKAFEQKKGSQMVVLLVPTTQPEAIEQYSLRVAEAWKIGRKGVNDGVILLVAKNDRKLRIEVGYGLEGAIPDAIAKRIIAEVITPRFRSGDFAGGIKAGVEKLTAVAGGEALPPPPAKKSVGSSRGSSGFDFLPFAIFAVVVAGVVLRSLAGRFVGASLTGGVSGIAAFFILGSLGIAVVAAIIVFIIVLLTSFGNWGSGGGWSSGGGGWSSGGSGGSDSFSGGGGDFGGGGASGDW